MPQWACAPIVLASYRTLQLYHSPGPLGKLYGWLKSGLIPNPWLVTESRQGKPPSHADGIACDGGLQTCCSFLAGFLRRFLKRLPELMPVDLMSSVIDISWSWNCEARAEGLRFAVDLSAMPDQVDHDHLL